MGHARDPLMMHRPAQPLPGAWRVLRIDFPHYLGLYLFGMIPAMFTKAQKLVGFYYNMWESQNLHIWALLQSL